MGALLAGSAVAMAQGLIAPRLRSAAAAKSGSVVLSTPLVLASGATRIHCTIVNVSSQTITTTTRIVSETGTVLAQFPAAVRAPGTGGSQSQSPLDAAYRCEFSYTGVPSDVRASMQITNNSTGEIQASADAY